MEVKEAVTAAKKCIRLQCPLIAGRFRLGVESGVETRRTRRIS